jgi:hypothetical protein
MNHRPFCAVTATIFTLVALLHISRLVNGWAVTIDTMSIPMFISWFGAIGPACLAFWGYRLAGAAR